MMAKKKKKAVSSTIDLMALRQNYYRRSIWAGIGTSLLVLVLYIVWVIVAILVNGYGSIEPSIKGSTKFPYFDTGKPLSLDFTDLDIALRWIVGIIVLIVAIILGIFVSKKAYKRYDAKARKVQSDSLMSMVKEELGIDSVVIRTEDTSEDQGLYKQIAIDEVKKKYQITIASDVMSYDVQQVEYIEDGRTKSGILFVTVLSNAKSAGYVQFRSYGSLQYKQHNGRDIGVYALSSNPYDSQFVVYTDLSAKDIGRLIDGRMIEEANRLHALVKGGLLITTNANTLSVFMADANFNFTNPLKDRLDGKLLETQCEAINAIYESILAITKSFSNLPTNVPMVGEKLGEEETESADDYAHSHVD